MTRIGLCYLILDSSKVYLLTSSENCALSMVPADKRTEKERERKRLEPTVCGRIVVILRIMSFNNTTSEMKYNNIEMSPELETIEHIMTIQ